MGAHRPHAQAFRLSSYAGRAHLFIQAVSNTSSAFGRSLGLHASIQCNSSNNAALSSSLITPIPQDCLGSCIHCSNRLPHVHMSHSLLSGLPVSSNHLNRCSHLSHHSDGGEPCKWTCCAVISSWGVSIPSMRDLWASSSKIVQPRLHISDEKERGVVGSKSASGGRITRGVHDSKRDLSDGRKATPKSLSNSFASLRATSSLAMPSHTGGIACEGTPGAEEVGCPSRRKTGSFSGAPNLAYNCSTERLLREDGSWRRRLPR